MKKICLRKDKAAINLCRWTNRPAEFGRIFCWPK